MLVLQIPAWFAATNAWVVAPSRGDAALLIDAPPEPDRVGEVLVEHDLSVAGILLTHGHVDHTGGSGVLAGKTGASVYVHPADDFLTLHPGEQLRRMWGMMPPGAYDLPERFERLDHGQVLALAGQELEVRHTPGHTPGHCCFYWESQGILFSGDQLFAGSVGRTDLPGGSMAQLLTSMREHVLDLPDETRVLPGHGPETTVGQERRHNPFRQLWEN